MITQKEIDKIFEYANEKEMLKRILEEMAKIQSQLSDIKQEMKK